MKPFARVLLTNDDGIDAPGLAILEDIAQDVAEEVWIVAPASDQSGASQKITLHAPVICTRRDERHFAIEGTPVDCVAMGLHLMRNTLPDVVLCGVNSGANMGDEVNLSGTLGAAAMAQTMGFTAFALSQKSLGPGNGFPWRTSRVLGPAVLTYLAEKKLPKATCVSINFPMHSPEEAKGLRWVPQGHGNVQGVTVAPCPHPRGLEAYWLTLRHEASPVGNAGTDIDRLAAGEITLSLIGPNRSLPTDEPFLPMTELAARHG